MKNTTNRIAAILLVAVALAPSSLSEAGDPVFDEAISRAVTVVNWAPDPVVFDEAISRAVTVCNRAGVGDLDGDGDIDMDDLVIFVDVLLGLDTDPAHVEGSDLTCDDEVDGLDVQPFVDAVVG